MGMESYFIHIKIKAQDIDDYLKNPGIDLSVKNYSRFPKKLFRKEIYDGNTFLLDNCVVLSIKKSCDGLDISLEACYANYDKSLETMYRFYSVLFNKYGNPCLIYGTLSTDKFLANFHDFKEWVDNCNPQKREMFFAKYNQFSEDVLPNDFYRFIKRHKKGKKINAV